MRGLWAVTRQTVTEVIRSRLTAVFAAGLAAVLLLLPLISRGDSPKEQVQTYLAYSFGLTGLVLSVMTILLGVSMLCGEVESRRIFLPLTKPVRRWVYVLGRWLGLVLMQAGMLAGSGAVIYGVTHTLRQTPSEDPVLAASQREAMDRQVFVARARFHPEPLPVQQYVQARLDQLAEEDRLDDAIDEFSANRQAGLQMLQNQLAQQAMVPLQTAQPLMAMTRSEDGEPVYQFIRSNPDVLVWQFKGLDKPVDPNATIQFAFRYYPDRTPEGDLLRRVWRFVNPQTQQYFPVGEPPAPPRSDPVRMPVIIEDIPAGLISDEGELDVVFLNFDPQGSPSQNAVHVRIEWADVFVMYPVGGFTGNFIRGVAMMVSLQMFLAALSMLAGSFLSMPVATLTTFVLLLLGLLKGFVGDATNLQFAPDVLSVVGYVVSKLVYGLLPDFALTNPGQSLVEGMRIGLDRLGRAIGFVGLLGSAMALLPAGIIFSRRELARVTV